jgi:probable rRNA maturation factor
MPARIEVQVKAGVTAAWVGKVATKASQAAGRGQAELSVVFVGAARIKALNAYRGKKVPTDILSFPAERPEDLGDIFICPPEARRKAAERGLTYKEYLALLVVHGVLHLAGYDHRTAKESSVMEAMEKKILESL